MTEAIQTTLGRVQGIQKTGKTGKKYNCYLGIPYAEPPIGDLRFRRAVPAAPWEGIKECTAFGPKPVQLAGGKFGKLTESDHPESEDCLTLNVWAPVPVQEDKTAPGEKEKGCPVFVWIYGGGFHAGEASSPEYDLSGFAEQGVLGFSFNYRLGVLGFYDFSDLSPEYESNCGISDMLTALQFIRDNAAAFGGDPERITIAGESAGGSAVMALLACPTAEPLFSQAVCMSGSLPCITDSVTAAINRKRFMKKTGLSEESIGLLKTMDIETLKAGCAVFFAEPEEENPGIMCIGPSIDDLIPEHPLEAFKKGAVRGKRIIFGTCQNEGTLFRMMQLGLRDWRDVEKMLEKNGYADRLPAFRSYYGGDGGSSVHSTEAAAIVKIDMDRKFWSGTMQCVKALSQYNTVYKYLFSFTTILSRFFRLGATHTMDICPMLGTDRGPSAKLYNKLLKNGQLRLQRCMFGTLLCFIRKGLPDTTAADPGAEVWEPWKNESPAEYVFGYAHFLNRSFDENRFELWDGLRIYEEK